MDALGKHLSGIIIEQKEVKKTKLHALKKAYRRYGSAGTLERVITKVGLKIVREEQRKNNALKEVLGGTTLDQPLPSNIPTLETHSANSAQAIEWIKAIQPDYIFVYGTRIIGSNVLSLPSFETLNLHTGISPIYRGSDSSFWALYNDDPLMVGATVHKCSPEIDGGNIYGRRSARLSELDDHYFAFAKSVKVGAELYSKVAIDLINNVSQEPFPQDFSLGKEYRFKDRTIFHEVVMICRAFSGRLKKSIRESGNAPLPYNDCASKRLEE